MKMLNNIQKYQLRDTTIAYYDDINKKIYHFLNFELEAINQLEVLRCHWFFNTEKYLKIGYDGTRECVGYIIDNKIEKKLIHSYISIVNEIGVAYDYSESDGRMHKEMLFALPEEKQLLSVWLPNSIFHVQAQYWVNDIETDFKLIDVNKGEIVWTIPQPTVEKPDGYTGLTNIKKVLGIYKDCLWLQLPDSRLWKLDLHTGRVLEELEAFYFASIPEGIFLSQQGIIFILHYNIYAQYSLEQGIFTIDKQITNENELIIRYVLFKEKDNYLYFTGNKDQSFSPNVYGIFDMETETIVFQGEMIEEGGYFYEIPQVNDELFTILDAKGNLIIHRLDDLL